MTEYALRTRMLALAAILVPCSLALTWMLEWLVQLVPLSAVLFTVSLVISWLLLVCIVVEGEPANHMSSSEKELRRQLHAMTLSSNNLTCSLDQAYANHRAMASHMAQQKSELDSMCAMVQELNIK